jgi:hypothetical protein
MEASSYPLLER